MFLFSSRRRHTIFDCDWSSDVCSSDLHFSRELGAGGHSNLVHMRRQVIIFAAFPVSGQDTPCHSQRSTASGSTISGRKSTRLNSSHSQISYAVFCLEKKKNISHTSAYT